jgi:hypothetical protein
MLGAWEGVVYSGDDEVGRRIKVCERRKQVLSLRGQQQGRVF